MDEPIGSILDARQIRALQQGLDAKKSALSHFAESLKIATQALTILRDGGTADPEAIFAAFEAVWPA